MILHLLSTMIWATAEHEGNLAMELKIWVSMVVLLCKWFSQHPCRYYGVQSSASLTPPLPQEKKKRKKVKRMCMDGLQELVQGVGGKDPSGNPILGDVGKWFTSKVSPTNDGFEFALWEPDICVAKLYYWILSTFKHRIPCLSVGLCTFGF